MTQRIRDIYQALRLIVEKLNQTGTAIEVKPWSHGESLTIDSVNRITGEKLIFQMFVPRDPATPVVLLENGGRYPYDDRGIVIEMAVRIDKNQHPGVYHSANWLYDFTHSAVSAVPAT
jgi:hypothetical protein